MDLKKTAPMLLPRGGPKAPTGQLKTIETLLPDDCRWPIGDPQGPGFHFCGNRKANGPYCDVHMRQGFQPSRPRAVYYRSRDAA